jgi:PTS system mannose-specific IIA component
MSDTMKVGVVVVTHGQLATELVNSVEMIVGDLPHVAAVSIGWHDDADRAREEIRQAIARVDNEAVAGVLVLTDMFGGTPTNLAVTLVTSRVEVITGVNLPMLVKLANLDRSNAGLLGIARQVREHAREAIRVASDLMRPDAGS